MFDMADRGLAANLHAHEALHLHIGACLLDELDRW
jgi:hypothetical protein